MEVTQDCVHLRASSIVIFWIVTPCRLVGGYQRFGDSTMKMEAILFSETLVTTYTTTRRHNSEDHNLQLHRRERFEILHCGL
jgi:hypothetical protein